MIAQVWAALLGAAAVGARRELSARAQGAAGAARTCPPDCWCSGEALPLTRAPFTRVDAGEAGR
ncbi:hypothetical protein GA0115246_1038911 [Streptomyces sp. SolWspMP-sol7th]|nr:hypothetical protein GA0115246_1038911 [Streptomyces sp. SolWspMP-sol7th]